jgi:hypothetical protein
MKVDTKRHRQLNNITSIFRLAKNQTKLFLLDPALMLYSNSVDSYAYNSRFVCCPSKNCTLHVKGKKCKVVPVLN